MINGKPYVFYWISLHSSPVVRAFSISDVVEIDKTVKNL